MKSKLIFWGTPLFAVPSLKSLHDLALVSAVISQPDRPAGRGKKLVSSPVKEYAKQNNIDVLEPSHLDEAFVLELKKYLPATFVVVAYGKIIPQDVLDLSELLALNIHPSALPILRGPSPIQTAILKGFETTAVSLMQLDKKMDHGPILGQIEAKIEPNEDYIELSERLSSIGADLLTNKIRDYLDGKLTPQVQDDSQATFCKMIKKEDGKIDWQDTAINIHNKVRAYRAWPSAFTTIKDIDIKIIKTKIVDKNLQPAEIFIEKDEFIIGTGDKSLQVLELQPSGKKIMTASEFLRGYQNKLK
ncbi:methionyl-tRNA formyltransferase [Candidatus Parcubacteria bacterium]|jgi:methionyl-tRNA formyltransferase|nr:methionyl-tRNA formyltransferase [Candidatus Parcubacteria bacterium]